jgi:hypothetical protein
MALFSSNAFRPMKPPPAKVTWPLQVNIFGAGGLFDWAGRYGMS